MNKESYKKLLMDNTTHLDIDSVCSILQHIPEDIDLLEYESSIKKCSGEYKEKVISIYKQGSLSHSEGIVYTPSGPMSTRDYSIQELGVERTNKIFPLNNVS